MGSQTGKVAIVTGGSRGIGRAIARRLAGEGGKVVIAARDRTTLDATAREIANDGGQVATVPMDLRSPDAPAALARAALDTYGAIDIVVNNAGATKRGDFQDLTDEDWSDGFALKFFAAVRLVRAAWPHLKARRGAVLNIIGVGGRTPGAEFTIGGSVNGASLTFTKALADVGVRDGVRVNAINPGYIRTDRLSGWLEASARKQGISFEAAADDMVRLTKTVRLGAPEDVANLAAFVLSAEGTFLHGALLDLDGGMTKSV
jgi:3-oxoacyl-[acyl-carrier protein] reductase